MANGPEQPETGTEQGHPSDPPPAPPLAERLGEQLRTAIETGQWKPGSRLPSTRGLAKRYAVSVNTAQAALKLLDDQGLVQTRPRRRAVVAADLKRLLYRSTSLPRGQVRNIVALYSLQGETDWALPILRSAERVLRRAGYHLSLLSYDEQQDNAASELSQRLKDMGPSLAGALLFATPELKSLPNMLEARELPWASVNRFNELTNCNYVTADNFGGGRILGRLLSRMGRRHVAILTAPFEFSDSAGEKARGLWEGLAGHDRSPCQTTVLRCDSRSEEHGYHRTQEYLRMHGTPDAIFASGDFLAQGAIEACREAGLGVPGDVAVVGATGLRSSANYSPALSVLVQPMKEMGHELGRMLLTLIRDPDCPRLPGRHVFSPLILRESLAVDETMRAEVEAEQRRRQELLRQWQESLPEPDEHAASGNEDANGDGARSHLQVAAT